MRKERIPVFLLVCLVAGVLLIMTITGSLLPVVLAGVFRIIAAILIIIILILIMILSAVWSLKEKEDNIRITLDDEDVYKTIQDCVDDIARYLRDNKSTSYFRKKLEHISLKLENFQNRFDTVHNLLEKRFGKKSISYNKFSIPIEELKIFVFRTIENLMRKMLSFNEEEYADKITLFRKSGRISEIKGHLGLEKEYKNYIKDVSIQLDNVVLKMDELILEMSKLNDVELEKTVGVLCAIDNSIKDTRLYS